MDCHSQFREYRDYCKLLRLHSGRAMRCSMPGRDPVRPPRLAAILAKLKSHLGDADFNRLQMILPLFRNGQATLAKCLQVLYPDKGQEDAQTAFRKFRQKVNRAGEEHGLAIDVD